MDRMLRTILAGAALIATLSLSGCGRSLETGTLEGRVSIGPLCPVETNPPDPNCLPTAETYNAWPIGVYRANTLEETLSPAPPDGAYRLELPAGRYTLKLENPSPIGGSNLPAEIVIYADETSTYDVEIDTGIR